MTCYDTLEKPARELWQGRQVVNDTDRLKAQALRAANPEWQITHITSPEGWIALNRPTQTAQHMLAGRDLDELAAKLVSATAT